MVYVTKRSVASSGSNFKQQTVLKRSLNLGIQVPATSGPFTLDTKSTYVKILCPKIGDPVVNPFMGAASTVAGSAPYPESLVSAGSITRPITYMNSNSVNVYSNWIQMSSCRIRATVNLGPDAVLKERFIASTSDLAKYRKEHFFNNSRIGVSMAIVQQTADFVQNRGASTQDDPHSLRDFFVYHDTGGNSIHDLRGVLQLSESRDADINTEKYRVLARKYISLNAPADSQRIVDFLVPFSSKKQEIRVIKYTDLYSGAADASVYVPYPVLLVVWVDLAGLNWDSVEAAKYYHLLSCDVAYEYKFNDGV